MPNIHKKNPHKYFHPILLLMVVTLVLIIQGCSQGQPPLISLNPTAEPQPTQEAVKIDPLATITFQVEIPSETPPEQAILLSLLDEVTGLGLNISRHEMQSIGDSTYSITLPFPVGANIKYRYARQDSFLAEEHSTDQHPVRYRMYRVDGPGIVKDIVAAWSDSSYSGPMGRIMGTVKNSGDGDPIPNLLVLAGGVQTVTSSTGSFLIEGLPPGLHNLVLYAFDGGFRTYQQGALVASDATTPAEIQLAPAPLVKMIFSVKVPDGTLPAVPIRMAGNLEQLGNTFANLSGGVNTLASRMPALTVMPDGSYALEIDLPAGAFIEYKYTLGDGFWNSEYTPQGAFRLRSLTVPNEDSVIQDVIDNWGESVNAGPLLFDLKVPDTTPEFDQISIQFSPFDWMEPIPMWKLGEDHWVYMLFSPLTKQDAFHYRYCRNDQCGRADDQETPGYNHPGREVEIPEGNQTITINDTVDSWFWLNPEVTNEESGEQNIILRSEGFITGVELQTYYHPSITPRYPVMYKEIDSLGTNWVFLSPTWTFTWQNPPLLESVSGLDQSWNDLSRSDNLAQSFGMQVGYYPQVNFPSDANDWWQNSTLDFPWWQVWFERYRSFIFSFADKAQIDGAQGLVIGGDWISPALPGGKLLDGTPSGVPADAEQRWRDIIAQIRTRFDGQIFWALPAGGERLNPPPFIEDLDHVYLLWSLPLASSADYSASSLRKSISDYLDDEVFLLNISLEMPITIAAAYPSAVGSLQGCIPQDSAGENIACFNPRQLEPPFPELTTTQHDLAGQSAAYSALLAEINTRDWLDGFVSRGYYAPAALQDKSASVHGKPAQFILESWFPALIPAPPTGE